MSVITAKYIRLSSEDDDLGKSGKVESNSVTNQRNLLDAFISRTPELADTSVIEFCDDGWSGKNFERPAVQRAEAGTVNVPASSFLRPLRLSGLRQHVLNQDPVALGRLVDHHVGHRPHNLPVLQNRAAAHE